EDQVGSRREIVRDRRRGRTERIAARLDVVRIGLYVGADTKERRSRKPVGELAPRTDEAVAHVAVLLHEGEITSERDRRPERAPRAESMVIAKIDPVKLRLEARERGRGGVRSQEIVRAEREHAEAVVLADV